MECPHLSSNISGAFDSSRFPNGAPSSWCCNGKRSGPILFCPYCVFLIWILQMVNRLQNK
uniref:Uncharacterized protein n=1 Tax=Amphilophus citrinellus TaxID=61819 RepID=A0A3Q0QYK0_AMPCI